MKLSIFADPSNGNLSDGGSNSDYLIMLVKDDGKCSPSNCQPKHIKGVVTSTLAGETLPISDAVDDRNYISEIVESLVIVQCAHASKHDE